MGTPLFASTFIIGLASLGLSWYSVYSVYHVDTQRALDQQALQNEYSWKSTQCIIHSSTVRIDEKRLDSTQVQDSSDKPASVEDHDNSAAHRRLDSSVDDDDSPPPPPAPFTYTV
eukprot:SAG31_NODE_20677_length_568_cov_0.759062_1_plen_114_part_10